MKKVLVIGSINTDLTISSPRRPEMGETVIGDVFFTAFGGKGVNQAAALAKQGSEVKFIGAVGKDANGAACLENLKNMGIDFNGEIIDNVSTGAAVITVCGGDNCIILHEGANALVSADIVKKKEELFKWADAVVMQLEIPVATVEESFKLAKKHGCVTVLNPAPSKPLPEEIFKYTDIIIPNEHEAADLTGIECENEKDFVNAAQLLQKKGAKKVIITLGEKGYMYFDNEAAVFKKAEKADAVDTTAAGDSFIGAFISEYTDGGSIEKASQYASKAAAVTVSRFGASDSIPTRKEMEEKFI